MVRGRMTPQDEQLLMTVADPQFPEVPEEDLHTLILDEAVSALFKDAEPLTDRQALVPLPAYVRELVTLLTRVDTVKMELSCRHTLLPVPCKVRLPLMVKSPLLMMEEPLLMVRLPVMLR